jgi:hypothetical protein
LLLRSRRQNDIGPDSASAKESKLLTQSGLAKFVGSWACRCLPSDSTGHVSVKPCCKNSTITLNSKQEPLRIEDCKGTPMVVLSDKRTFVHRHEEKGADGSLVSVTWVSTKDSTEEIKWDRKSCKHGFGANNQKHEPPRKRKRIDASDDVAASSQPGLCTSATEQPKRCKAAASQWFKVSGVPAKQRVPSSASKENQTKNVGNKLAPCEASARTQHSISSCKENKQKVTNAGVSGPSGIWQREEKRRALRPFGASGKRPAR